MKYNWFFFFFLKCVNFLAYLVKSQHHMTTRNRLLDYYSNRAFNSDRVRRELFYFRTFIEKSHKNASLSDLN